MKYRIIAPIIFILGLAFIAFMMNQSEDVVAPPPHNPTTNQVAPAQQPSNDPFKGVKIP